MNSLLDLLGKTDDYSSVLLTGMLIIFRVLPIVFMTPFLGGKLVPPETKMALSLLLAVIVWPLATQGMVGPLEMNPLVYIVLMLKEVFVGYVIGFVAAEIFYAMEMGGRMLDVTRGSNMAEVQVPELSLRASPVGDFLLQLLLIVFMGIGGHRFFISAFADSFAIVPIDGWPEMSGTFKGFVEQILRYTGSMVAIGLTLTFPGIFATFMTDLVFGMLNRVAPQLNAYFMAMGVKAMSALALLLFSLGLIAERMTDLTEETVLFVRDLIQLFG